MNELTNVDIMWLATGVGTPYSSKSKILELEEPISHYKSKLEEEKANNIELRQQINYMQKQSGKMEEQTEKIERQEKTIQHMKDRMDELFKMIDKI